MNDPRMQRCPSCGTPRTVDAHPPATEPIERTALRVLADDLDGCPADCWQFFAALFRKGPTEDRAKGIANAFDILPSTMLSRFFRADLPSPKKYALYAKYVRAARMLENRRNSISDVATCLGESSHQSFNRSIRIALGMTAQQFRDRYDGERMLAHFRAELVTPHVETLKAFHPLVGVER